MLIFAMPQWTRVGLIVSVLAVAAIVSDPSGVSGAGDDQKWVVSEGRSVIAGKSPEAAQQEAIRIAQNDALGTCSKEITSSQTLITTEENSRLGKLYRSLILSRTHGRVLDWETLQDTIFSGRSSDGKQELISYVKLRCLVQCEEPEGPSPYEVRLSLNRDDFEAGDKLAMTIAVTKTCYLHVFNAAADGKVYILFPRRAGDERAIPGQSIVEFPNEDASLELQPLPGHDVDIEDIMVIATEQPIAFSPADVKYIDNGPGFLPSAVIELSRLQIKLGQIPYEKRGQEIATYTIHQRKGTSDK